MSSHLSWCDTVLYKQNVVTEQSENDHCLRKVSVQSKLLLINSENRISISVCKNENNNVSIVQNESFTSCQLRDTYLYKHLHDDCCCCCCCCWACCTRVSADIFNQERFHIWKVLMKKLKKKEKEKLYVRWGVYNSLYWQVSSSELLKEITQAMKKFSSANLTHTKQKNMCQQTLTTVQQPFQKLKAQS